jgi:hypothetical protein
MKMIPSRAAIAIAFALTIPGIAGAGTMFTAPLKPGDGNVLTCRITNVDDTSHPVSIAIYGYSYRTNTDGTQIGTFPTIDAPPLATVRFALGELATPELAPHVCKFTTSGNQGNFRAVGCVTEGATGIDITCVPAD